jgi:hypothetical protein
MSPLLIGERSSSSRSKADTFPANSPAPKVAAPAATVPLFKNVRRFVPFVKTLLSRFIALSPF